MASILSRPQWGNEVCSPPGSSPFSTGLLATLGRKLDAIRTNWKEGGECLGSRLTFHPRHVLLGSSPHSQLASPWPRRHVGPEMPLCHMLHVCLAQTQHFVQRSPSRMVACDPSESGCSDACSPSHPGWPRCSAMMDCTPDLHWWYFYCITKY